MSKNHTPHPQTPTNTTIHLYDVRKRKEKVEELTANSEEAGKYNEREIVVQEYHLRAPKALIPYF